MVQQVKKVFISTREFLFQAALHALVFTFFVFDSEHPHADLRIEPHQMAFFINYAAANAVISYVLLPRYYYQKRYWHFILFTLLIVGGVIAIEEFFLEKIYFPDSRGARFPGILFTVGQVFPIIAILSGFKFAWDALIKQREVEELRAVIRESELQFLRSQINPHFLFNNLNNLYSYAVANSPKTPAIILELSAVLRYMLYDCREKFVPLSKEVEQLRNFTQLYELQIEERGVVNFTTHNVHEGYLIAPLILIVFIENAFKHSQASLSGDIVIDISIRLLDEGTLEFCCVNNFQPVADAGCTSGGIGLENVKKRLQLIYPEAHRLEIRQQDNRYEVLVTMQLEKGTNHELHHH